MGVGGKRHVPAALRPGKTLYPIYRKLVGPEGWPGPVSKSRPPPTGILPPESPSRSKSLYRPSYLGAPSKQAYRVCSDADKAYRVCSGSDKV